MRCVVLSCVVKMRCHAVLRVGCASQVLRCARADDARSPYAVRPQVQRSVDAVLPCAGQCNMHA
eukprot:11758459-Alexandrium_andersonii.AAC.1